MTPIERQSAARFFRPAALRRHPPGARRRPPSTRCSPTRARDDRARRHRRGAARRGTTSSSRSPSALDRLDRAWGAVRHLNAVVNTPALRDAYNANLPKVTAFYTDLGQDLRLYARYRALARCAGVRDARRRAAQGRSTTSCAISGWAAPSSPTRDKARFKAVQEELAELVGEVRRQRARRDQRVGALRRRRGRARRRSRRRRRRGARRGASRRQDGYKLTLRMPCYLPVMQYADNRALRATLHRALRDARVRPRRHPRVGQRAGHRAHPRAAARGGAAARLRATTPRCRWCRRWRSAPAEVLAFLRDLARARKPVRRARLRGARRRSRATSSASPTSRRGTSRTRPRSSRRARYAFSEQEVKQYFPGGQGARRAVPRRRDDLRRRRSARVRRATWHPSVRFFEIRDRARRARRPVLPRPLRARRQAGRRVDGRRDQPAPHRRRGCSIRSRT